MWYISSIPGAFDMLGTKSKSKPKSKPADVLEWG